MMEGISLRSASWFVQHYISDNKIIHFEMDGYVADVRKRNTYRNLDNKSEKKRPWEI
jgi:hypothetical protein